jgi:hypothetical protein
MFSFLKNDHPRPKIVYAVTGGKYLGELLVFMEKNDSTYSFLALPEMVIREVPADKFKFGLTEKIIDIVQKIPTDVYSVCKAQYTKNKSLITNTLA